MRPVRNITAVILLVVVADWISKILVKKFSPNLPFRIIENPGLLLGIDLPGFFDWLVAMVLPLFFIFLYFSFFAHSSKADFGFALILGGATANLLDRLLDGQVMDFINLGVSTANLADLAIMGGIGVLLFSKTISKS